MGRIQSIPVSHWSHYLKAASRRFHDQPVELDVTGPNAVSRAIAHGLYFQGAFVEGGHRPGVVLQVARLGALGSHLSHRIAEPTLIVRELDERGELDRIVIQDRDQQRTTLVFHDDTPEPGLRRLPRRSESTHCDDPRCPLGGA